MSSRSAAERPLRARISTPSRYISTSSTRPAESTKSDVLHATRIGTRSAALRRRCHSARSSLTHSPWIFPSTFSTHTASAFPAAWRVVVILSMADDLKSERREAGTALDGVDDLARSPKVADALAGLREALASIHRVTAALEPGVTPTMKGLDATLAQAR
jgi:hypothetical protein